MRILIIDDDSSFVAELVDNLKLRDLKFEFDSVYDVQSAIRCLHLNIYDVIICDLVLPGAPEGGMKVLEEIEAQNLQNSARIFVLSGSFGFKPEDFSVNIEFLRKPIRPSELFKLISKNTP